MYAKSRQPGSRPADSPANTCLHSWKEIAGHLTCSERTARRWERTEGLPIHRHRHQKRAGIFAYTAELDAWWNDGRPQVEQRERAHAAVHRRRLLWLGAAGVALAAVAAALLVSSGVLVSGEPRMKVTPLTTLVGMELAPALSPDGTRVAFLWTGQTGSRIPDLYVRAIDAQQPLRLTSTPDGYENSPAWSPDGRSIAFVRSDPSGSAIFTVPSPGGPERRLVSLSQGGRGLDWGPDGQLLIFPDKIAPREPGSIYLFSPRTLERRRLTWPPEGAAGDSRPAFSPDGSALAFVRSDSGLDSILITRLAGGEPKRLVTENGPIFGVAWAEKGRTLIYSAPAGPGASHNSLWRIAVAGGVPERLTGGLDNARAPTVSRHKSRLAYARFSVDVNIWRVEAQYGTGRWDPPRVLISSTREDAAPQLSPDGTKIAFQSDRSGNREIWVCDSDGSNPIQLTSLGGASSGSPRWSPDGRQIAFRVLGRPGKPRMGIYVIPADGGIARALNAGDADDTGAPSWSRDARWVYLGSGRTGRAEVWKVPISGGQPSQVTRNGGSVALESPDGRFLYYVKPDRPGLWRMSAAGGQETQVLDALDPAQWGSWVVVEGGIYFIEPSVPPHGAICFYNSATKQVSQILRLAREPDSWDVALDVSPDGRRILFTLIDAQNSDLILMENLR